MKFLKLRTIVAEHAYDQKESAGWMGAQDDGGSSSTMAKLKEFKESLIYKHNLRPSEYNKLDCIEVFEPAQFKEAIDREKVKIAKKMIL